MTTVTGGGKIRFTIFVKCVVYAICLCLGWRVFVAVVIVAAAVAVVSACVRPWACLFMHARRQTNIHNHYAIPQSTNHSTEANYTLLTRSTNPKVPSTLSWTRRRPTAPNRNCKHTFPPKQTKLTTNTITNTHNRTRTRLILRVLSPQLRITYPSCLD